MMVRRTVIAGSCSHSSGGPDDGGEGLYFECRDADQTVVVGNGKWTVIRAHSSGSPDDGGEGLCFECRAADQAAVNVVFRKQLQCIVGLHAAPILQAD